MQIDEIRMTDSRDIQWLLRRRGDPNSYDIFRNGQLGCRLIHDPKKNVWNLYNDRPAKGSFRDRDEYLEALAEAVDGEADPRLRPLLSSRAGGDLTIVMRWACITYKKRGWTFKGPTSLDVAPVGGS